LAQSNQQAVVFLVGFTSYVAEAHKGQYNEGYLNLEKLLKYGILLLNEKLSDPNDKDSLEPVQFGISAEYTQQFLILRCGQLVDIAKNPPKKKKKKKGEEADEEEEAPKVVVKNQFLDGVGRRIKLKPIWKKNREGKTWNPSLGLPVDEFIDGFEGAFCLCNEGQWKYDVKSKVDVLNGFGRSVRSDGR